MLCGALTAALGLTSVAAKPAGDILDWGADLRLRQIYIDNVGLNANSPTADRNFQRYRARLWGQAAPNDQFEASARLMWEGRHYGQPAAFDDWYSGGILFDQLLLNFKQIGGSPLSVKAGRQDIILGNGWLVLDGSPIDGSRTIYFDAVRATYRAESLGTTVELIYLDQSADTGRFPQALNGEVEDQTEQDERGLILYLRNDTLVPDSKLDLYFIQKRNDPNRTPGNIRINNGAPFPSPSDDGTVNSIGARIDGNLAPNWAIRAEAAGQWGDRNDRDVSAFGFNGRATYAFADPLANRLHLGYEYLSGDKPGTRDNEAFDPLWGRWPQWSELMIYQWPLETRVGEATNLHRLNLGWAIKPHATTEVTLDYNALWADQQSTRTAAQLANLSQDGTFRGHLWAAWAKTRLNRHLSGHLVAEYFAPGDYYAAHRRDDSLFFRAEVMLAW